MSDSVDVRLAHLKDGYDALVGRDDLLERRIGRGERQRVRIFWAFVCVLVVALGAVILSGYLLLSRGDSRAYYNTCLGRIVVALPPGGSVKAKHRAMTDCGQSTPVKVRRHH